MKQSIQHEKLLFKSFFLFICLYLLSIDEDDDDVDIDVDDEVSYA